MRKVYCTDLVCDVVVISSWVQVNWSTGGAGISQYCLPKSCAPRSARDERICSLFCQWASSHGSRHVMAINMTGDIGIDSKTTSTSQSVPDSIPHHAISTAWVVSCLRVKGRSPGPWTGWAAVPRTPPLHASSWALFSSLVQLRYLTWAVHWPPTSCFREKGLARYTTRRVSR